MGGATIGACSCVGVDDGPASTTTLDLGCLSTRRGLLIWHCLPLASSVSRYGLPWFRHHDMYSGSQANSRAIMGSRVGKKFYLWFQMLIYSVWNVAQFSSVLPRKSIWCRSSMSWGAGGIVCLNLNCRITLSDLCIFTIAYTTNDTFTC